jgi:hypothetical protein
VAIRSHSPAIGNVPMFLQIFFSSAVVSDGIDGIRAFLCMQIPFLFISYYIESRVTIGRMKDSGISRKKIKFAVLAANVASYIFLSSICLLLRSALSHRPVG